MLRLLFKLICGYILLACWPAGYSTYCHSTAYNTESFRPLASTNRLLLQTLRGQSVEGIDPADPRGKIALEVTRGGFSPNWGGVQRGRVKRRVAGRRSTGLNHILLRLAQAREYCGTPIDNLIGALENLFDVESSTTTRRPPNQSSSKIKGSTKIFIRETKGVLRELRR